MRVWPWLLGVLLGTASAEPLPDRARYSQAMRAARKLAAAKRWSEAQAAFEAVLVVAPRDPLAQSEEALAIFHGGDPAAAEALLDAARAQGGPPMLQAPIYYNLGVVREARKDRAGAIEAYTRSLQLRWNATVQSALAKLDPAASDRLRAVPRAMAALLAPEERTAASLVREHEHAYFERAFIEPSFSAAEVRRKFPCKLLPTTIDLAGTGLGALELWECSGHDKEDRGWTRTVEVVATKTTEGWYAEPWATFWENRWNEGGTLRVLPIERQVVSGRSALVLRSETVEELWCRPDREEDDAYPYGERTRAMSLLGVGPSGAPSLTLPIDVSTEALVGEVDERPSVAFALDVRFPEHGIVLSGPVAAPTKVKRPKRWADIAVALKPGTLPVEFP